MIKKMFAAACLLLISTAALADDSVRAFKLGGTAPMTGPVAIYGAAIRNGAQLAVDEINAMNGSIKFDYRCEDDSHNARKAITAYNTLRKWGMQLSLASATSAPCEATAQKAYIDRIFALTPSASATTITSGKDNVFQMCFIDPAQGSAAAEYMVFKKLPRKVAVIWNEDDVYSSGVRENFVKRAKELHRNVVSDTPFGDKSDKNFTEQLKAAQAAGAGLVFLPIYYQQAARILTQADKLNYKAVFFGADAVDGILSEPGFNKKLAEGFILLTPFAADAKDEATQNFVKEYKKRHGDTPNQFAADAYDAVYALKAALEHAKATPDMDAKTLCDLMIKEFTSMKFNGITGAHMSWSASGEVSKDPNGVEVKNGEYVSLD